MRCGRDHTRGMLGSFVNHVEFDRDFVPTQGWFRLYSRSCFFFLFFLRRFLDTTKRLSFHSRTTLVASMARKYILPRYQNVPTESTVYRIPLFQEGSKSTIQSYFQLCYGRKTRRRKRRRSRLPRILNSEE